MKVAKTGLLTMPRISSPNPCKKPGGVGNNNRDKVDEAKPQKGQSGTFWGQKRKKYSTGSTKSSFTKSSESCLKQPKSRKRDRKESKKWEFSKSVDFLEISAPTLKKNLTSRNLLKSSNSRSKRKRQALKLPPMMRRTQSMSSLKFCFCPRAPENTTQYLSQNRGKDLELPNFDCSSPESFNEEKDHFQEATPETWGSMEGKTCPFLWISLWLCCLLPWDYPQGKLSSKCSI